MLLYSIVMAIMPFFAVFCFYAGFKLGKNDRLPEIKIESPAKKMEARKKSKEQQAELERVNKLMRNLANYQGDSRGQERL